jgi:hypothetical protein
MLGRDHLRTGGVTMVGVGPHLYVVGEREEPDGPVKIGLSAGGASGSGRRGINVGNWRTLYVEHRKALPFEDLRWTEWLVHKHLDRWRRRGEWFDVRSVAAPCGWDDFLTLAAAGDLPGCTPWRLGGDEHHLVRMRRLTRRAPRQFDAACSCGTVITATPGLTLPKVQVLFALDHLGLAVTDPSVLALTRRA